MGKVRRNKRSRRKARKKKGLQIVGILLGVVLVGTLAFFYLFRVTDIKVAGNTRYDSGVIQQYVQNDWMTSNTMLTGWFRNHIDVTDIPFVESLDIEALDNNTIRIYVNEKQIVGYVIEKTDKLYFDKDGYILEVVPMTEAEIQGLQTEMERMEELYVEEETQEMTEHTQGEKEPENTEEDSENEEDSESEADSENEEGSEIEEDESYIPYVPTPVPTVEVTVSSESIGEFQVVMPNVPRVLGLEMENLLVGQQIQVEDSGVFNTILGIWRMVSKYEIIPEMVFFDEENNITLIYQNGRIHCQLGQDSVLEEKITRVAAILPNITDKMGILHLEDYTANGEDIIFSQESEYTVKQKIYSFLQKNS